MFKTNLIQNVIFSKHALLILTVLFIGGGYLIWQNWPSLIMASMHWQKQINSQLSELLYDAHANSLSAGLMLAALSFVYGVLHSAGPGHGKLIVSTYIATHPTKVKISLMLTILSAILQAVVAIVLVSFLLTVFDSSMREINNEASRLVRFSFCMLVILGGMIVWRNLYTLWNLRQATVVKINTLIAAADNSQLARSSIPDHHHCGCCAHKHFADASSINKASSLKAYLAIILSIGLRPCTGAIMVLLFAHMVGIYWLGVLSALLMAIGTALTTSVIAMMALGGRQLVRRYIDSNQQTSRQSAKTLFNKQRTVILFIQSAGGLLLILMGSVLLSSQPVATVGIF